jgi:hypothetical protein
MYVEQAKRENDRKTFLLSQSDKFMDDNREVIEAYSRYLESPKSSE